MSGVLRTVALVALLPSVAAAQPTWELLDGSPYNSYRTEDLSFVDPETGWGVDGDGRVHRTTDGGETWAQMASIPAYLRSVEFVSPSRGWVGTIQTVGAGQKLFETRNGGLSFSDISFRIAGGTHGICSLSAVDGQTVYGAGTYDGPAVLVKTTDGGNAWASIPLAPHLDTAIDVHFWDADRGIVVGGTGNFRGVIRPRIIGTEDGGATWTVLHTGAITPAWGWKISVPTPEVGFVSVERYDGSPDSMVLKTTDGGRTWAELTFGGGTGNMQGIGFLSPEVGWISGRGATMRTLDGGQSWARVDGEGELDTNVNRFVFLDNGLGFASGFRIHRLDARLVASEADVPTGRPLAVSPNPARDVVRLAFPASDGAAVAEVFDAVGRRVARMEGAAGARALTWAVPEGLAPGAYVVRLRTDGGVWSRALAIVR